MKNSRKVIYYYYHCLANKQGKKCQQSVTGPKMVIEEYA